MWLLVWWSKTNGKTRGVSLKFEVICNDQTPFSVRKCRYKHRNHSLHANRRYPKEISGLLCFRAISLTCWSVTVEEKWRLDTAQKHTSKGWKHKSSTERMSHTWELWKCSAHACHLSKHISASGLAGFDSEDNCKHANKRSKTKIHEYWWNMILYVWNTKHAGEIKCFNTRWIKLQQTGRSNSNRGRQEGKGNRRGEQKCDAKVQNSAFLRRIECPKCSEELGVAEGKQANLRRKACSQIRNSVKHGQMKGNVKIVTKN